MGGGRVECARQSEVSRRQSPSASTVIYGLEARTSRQLRSRARSTEIQRGLSKTQRPGANRASRVFGSLGLREGREKQREKGTTKPRAGSFKTRPTHATVPRSSSRSILVFPGQRGAPFEEGGRAAPAVGGGGESRARFSIARRGG